MTGPAVLVALAVGLWVGPPASAPLARLAGRAVAGGGPRYRVLPAVILLVPPLLLGGAWPLWWLAALVAGATIVLVVVSRRRRRAAGEEAEEVAHGARALAMLLCAGRLPTEALAETALDCPAFEYAAGVSALGGDVGEALDVAAKDRGREQLRLIGAAWRLSERSGASMAETLKEVAETLSHRRSLGALVEAELAAARTSGHVMAGLPFAAVGLGVLVGADPLAFLFGRAWGAAIVLAAVVLTAAGVLWTERLASGAQP